MPRGAPEEAPAKSAVPRCEVPYPARCGSRDGRCPSLTPPTPKPKGGGAALRLGGVAQLGERLLCKQEVIGSIPFTSTIAQQREAMVCLGSRDSDILGMSRKRAVPRWCGGSVPYPARCGFRDGVARHWRRFALTALARRSWKHSVCLQCTCIAGVFFDR